jgi:hypothetical protein
MSTRDKIEAHTASNFKPNKNQEPLLRIAEALEYIASELHDISFDLEEAQDAINRVADR